MNAKKRDNSNASLPRLRALILEDNPGDAKLCTTHLERGGYDLQFDIVDTPDAFKDRLAGGEFDIRSAGTQTNRGSFTSRAVPLDAPACLWRICHSAPRSLPSCLYLAG